MMRLPIYALIFIALYATQARAQTPNAYRCGNSYSQTPCPGGAPVSVADDRSGAQKAQADAVIQRDRAMADSMEKSRLQQEEALRRQQAAAQAQAQAKKSPAAQKKTTPRLHIVKKSNSKNPDKVATKAPSGKTTNK